jgi:tetratricopeptide repeat protein
LFARFVAAIVLLAAAAAPSSAAPIDDAKKAFGEGKAAFERGDYETALSAYQHANMILPAPNLYYNIGTTYERLGRYQEAALAFDKYFELAGPAQTDEDRDFQSKLRARADADRRRPNVPTPRPVAPAPPTTPPPPVAPQPPPAYYGTPYYQPQPMPRDARLHEARARHTRAIVLMAIGVPMSVAGIALGAWAAAPDVRLTFPEEIGYIFLGITFGVVGVTLWAPGAASFVKSSGDLKRINSEPAPVTTVLPATTRGF